MKIDWGTVVTNVISAVIVLVILGAVKVLWEAAMSVEPRVAEAEARLQATIEVLTDEFDELQNVLENAGIIYYEYEYPPEEMEAESYEPIPNDPPRASRSKANILEEINTRQQTIKEK